MTQPAPEPSSFRDPRGQVFDLGGRILRSVAPSALPDLLFVNESGALRAAIAEGRVVGARDVSPALLGEHAPAGGRVLEHQRLPFISYPYEWPFALLRAAALHHLDLHLELLAQGVTLSDASAYNVQWDGAQPVFIDWLSFRRYRAGEYWGAHRQFCEQFLNPLLLAAELGVPHHFWYRGAQEGVRAEELAPLLPLSRRLSLRMQAHVFLPLRLAARAGDAQQVAAKVTARALPLSAFRALLSQLRGWIAGLRPRARATPWASYNATTSYSAAEAEAKRKLVREFARELRPELLLDVGCNTGEWSAEALSAGAQYAVGLDADTGALERAAERAAAGRLRFLPLYQDAANPSPAQGFASRERASITARAAGRADGLLALALLHHLVIARNLPLAQVLDWLLELAPAGLIEFVPKEDPRVQGLLALREDIFPEYRVEHFEALLGARARVRRAESISAHGRRIYWYDKT